MKSSKTIAVLLSILLIAATMLTACGNETNTGADVENPDKEPASVQEGSDSEEPEGPKDTKDADQTYRYATGSIITSLDPERSGAIPDWAAGGPIYENLTRYALKEDGTSEIQPGVATSWKCSKDGLKWTFHLRDNAKWSDGTPVTANDFEYTWQRVFDPEVASDYAWMVEPFIKGGSEFLNGEGKREDVGVKAIDEYTLEFELKKPCGYFISIAAFPTYQPVKKEFVEQFGEKYGSEAEKCLGNGPFMVESWNPGVGVTYVQNPYYWDKENIYLTKIERRVVKEDNPRAQALLKGELDSAAVIDPEWKKELDKADKFIYLSKAGAGNEFFLYKLDNKYLKNKKIRQALSIAFERERYNKEVWDGSFIPAWSMVPSTIHCGDLVYKDAVNGENEKVIKDLQAKYSDPKKLLIEGLKEEGLDPDPAKMKISFMSRGTGEKIKTQCEWLHQMYKEDLGIELETNMVPYNVMWDHVDEGDYEIASGGWTADIDDPTSLISIFHTVNGYYPEKKTGWVGEKAERFNELVDKADLTIDAEDKAKIYLEAEKILIDEAVVSPMYFGKSTAYRAKYVKNLHTNDFTYTDYKGVYIQGRE